MAIASDCHAMHPVHIIQAGYGGMENLGLLYCIGAKK